MLELLSDQETKRILRGLADVLHSTSKDGRYSPSSERQDIHVALVPIRFVNPTSFVYGSSEENEPETCMAEKLNLTFHVSKADFVDVYSRWEFLSAQCPSVSVMLLGYGIGNRPFPLRLFTVAFPISLVPNFSSVRYVSISNKQTLAIS